MADPFLDGLIEISIEAEEAKAEWLTLKEQTKEAKDRLDGLTDSILARLKRRREETGPDRLPFGDDDSGGGGGGGDGDPPKTPIPSPSGGGDVIDAEFGPIQPSLPAPQARVIRDESWRSEPLSNLTRFGLAPKTVEKFAEAGLKTVGDVGNWSASGHQLADVPGIGESKATETEEAFDAFWADWQHRQAQQPEPARKRRKTG